MAAVFRHELRCYFHSLTAYLFCAFLLLFVGIGAMIYNIQYGVASFEYVLEFVCIGMAIIIPVLTMRVLAEERKQKTDKLLFFLPLSSTDVILGKYFALLVIFLIPMVITAVYPILLSRYGDVSLLTAYGSLFAFVIMGAALIAIGMFISSLTESQGFAAGIAIVVLLLNYFCVTLANYVSTSAVGSLIALVVLIAAIALLVRYLTKSNKLAYGIFIVAVLVLGILSLIDATMFENLLPTIMEQVSLFDRFYDFVNGVFDITSIVFYLAVIVFFLFLSGQSLEKRRYN